MEEVDAIVIHTLRELGCEIDEVVNLKEFSTELVIQGVVRCLKIINPRLEVSHHVPPSMSARYRLGSALAVELTELGFKGEIGYQTFLYSNESDLRKIFLFLIEKLPKESEKVIEEPLGKLALIVKACVLYFKECLVTPWMPYYCKCPILRDGKFLMNVELSVRVPFKTETLFYPFIDKISEESKKIKYDVYCHRYQMLLCNQVTPVTNIICSVLEKNERSFLKDNKTECYENDLRKSDIDEPNGKKIKEHAIELVRQAVEKSLNDFENLSRLVHVTKESKKESETSSRFSHILELQFTSSDKQPSMPLNDSVSSKNEKEEDRCKMREKEIADIQEKIDLAASSIMRLGLQNKKLEGAITQISELICKETQKIEGIEQNYRVKKCTLSLLPDAKNNIEKLEALIESSSERLVSLANQWEQHRLPLIQNYRELKELSFQRQNETQRKVEEIRQVHDKIRETGVEARYKDELHKQLISSFEKLTKDLNRSAYTKRILEIVSNIKKQKSEINKVLLDTRNVQKEINRLHGKLERTFTVTDELIFRDAKKDEAVRRAYKLLAALHENFSQLVQITEDTGVIAREIRELEDQIEQENQKKVVATLERITSDYKQMQQENALLLSQFK